MGGDNVHCGQDRRRILDCLVAAQGMLVYSTAIDSTYIKVHRSDHGGKGRAKAHATGPSRGGQTTKIHAVTDLLGLPAILQLTAVNVADIAMAKLLLEVTGPVRCLIADKGYDTDALRKRLKSEGAQAVIQERSNRKVPISYDETRNKARWRIEAAFCGLKHFRRIATRYDNLARNFLSAVALSAVVAFWV